MISKRIKISSCPIFSSVAGFLLCSKSGDFAQLVKKFPSLKVEYKELIDEIIQNPEAGTFIGNSCYKIRVAIQSKGKGKSGGARAITYVYVQTKTVYLLTIYDKGEKANLKPNELKIMIESLGLE